MRVIGDREDGLSGFLRILLRKMSMRVTGAPPGPASLAKPAKALSILLFTEGRRPSGFFLTGVPGERSVLTGVEVKTTLHDVQMATSESKML
jgi:hypothetical protein